MQLTDLIQGFPIRLALPAGGTASLRICDLTEDSRTVVPGSLFIARAGAKADGRVFIAQALGAGAVAVLVQGEPDSATLDAARHAQAAVLSTDDAALASALLAERFYGSPSNSLDLVGVTGTNGKTTITWLIWQLLNGAGHRSGLIGTVIVDDGAEVAPANMTTPPAIEVSRTLNLMVDSGCKAAAMEASSHALHQKRVEALAFDVGVFTNLTGDHLDYHGTMESYAAAKARLFELLSPDAAAVVNAQDPWAPRMVRDIKPGVRLFPCVIEDDRSLFPPAPHTLATGERACVAKVRSADLLGMTLELSGPWGKVESRVNLTGSHNVMNVLQAVASAHAIGLSAERIAEGLSSLTAPPGRLERVSLDRDPVTVLVDYAHTDDALKNAIGAVRACLGSDGGGGTGGGGKLWVVFGCGGDRDKTKRPRMGRVAATEGDMEVVTNDNPRTERPSEIIDQILAGVPTERRGAVSVQPDRDRAIRYAIDHAQAGDVVLIAGKGHETEQILPDGAGGTFTQHFDDREVARAALADRFGARPEASPGRPTAVVRSSRTGAKGSGSGGSGSSGRRP
ncbi:MAG: UDP-N-acetylmuramoyl-L-alanyl-D-glutamate--2,6-diaminopimelate ligase [Planctomycetota bacterium]|nr:UDP-N-acetylmuramoyl-L-alanyl-D-glutamate--2,6-diaminopimelate ligase [Planctomycetota bacterium]